MYEILLISKHLQNISTGWNFEIMTGKCTAQKGKVEHYELCGKSWYIYEHASVFITLQYVNFLF